MVNPTGALCDSVPERNGSMDRQDFLDKLARFPENSFEARFLRTARRLGLVSKFSTDELRLLYRASFRAVLCNIAFNGLGGCDGRIKPQQELNRVRLEEEFMAASARVYACMGWRRLATNEQARLAGLFLTVLVADENLAW